MLKYFIFIFVSIFYNAQTSPFILNGLVANEEKTPVPNAVVLIKDNTYEYTVYTNEKGLFSKKIYNAGEQVFIKISHSKYDSLQTYIAPNQEKYTFTLFPKAKEIEEVVLQRGMIQKGDSTIYYADYYANKKENKVIDLLKKLPNVDVDRNGKIIVDGKEIDKVLVENETFFTGSSSLAINSLPANVVEKFEVINNYQENAILGGVSDKTVLNISLKEEKKKLVFGDIFLNGNSYDRYKVGANAFFYDPKTKINLISNINDSNENAFSMEDYFRFNGGFDRLLRDPASFMGNFSPKELLELLVPNEKYDNKQIFNAFNFSQNVLKNKLKLTLFNINNRNNSQERKENNIKFNHQNLVSLDRNEMIYRDLENKSNNFNFSLTNNKTDKIDFYYNLNLKNSHISSLQNTMLLFLDNQEKVYSENKNQGNNINQVLDINYKLSENHAQGVFVSFLLSENEQQVLTQSDRKSFYHSIFNLSNSENSILHQNKDINKLFRVHFQHKFNFLARHQVGVNLDFSNKNQDVNNDFEVNSQKESSLSNALSIQDNNINFGLEYLFKNRNITFSLIGDFITRYSDFDSNFNKTKTKNKFFLPTAKVEYKSGIGNFNVDYKRNIREIYAHYYFLGHYLLSASTIIQGIENPKLPLSENLNLRYNLKSGFYGYDIDVRYTLSNKLKDYTIDTETNSLQRTNVLHYINNAGKRNKLDIKLEKYLFGKKLSLIAQGIFDYDKQFGKVNGLDSETKIYAKNFNVFARSRFKGNYNFELYNQYHINNYKTPLSDVFYKMNELGVMLNFTPSDKWTINTDFSFNRDMVNNISYNKSIVKIDYFLNSNIYANLYINNILGSYRKVMINKEDFFSYYQQEYLMPRFFYAGFTYKF